MSPSMTKTDALLPRTDAAESGTIVAGVGASTSILISAVVPTGMFFGVRHVELEVDSVASLGPRSARAAR